MACTHESLSPYTFERSDTEPTNTFTVQTQFAQRLRGVLARINARIREAIISEDLFGLQHEALVDDVPEDVFDFPTTRTKVRGFLEWLRRQLDNNFLEVVGPDRNQFLERAYAEGIRNVTRQLRAQDIAFERADVDTIIGRPIHAAALRELYTRAYENLVSVRDDVAQSVRDELTTGFAEGKSPTDIANSLTDRVNSIGKHRSTLIARSEVMNAHSTATLNRAKEINSDADFGVAVSHGEWDAAMDERTCAFCRALDGVAMRPEEMEQNSVSVTGGLPESFIGGTFRLKPPAHPQGRCNIRVRVGGSIETPLNDRLPDGIQA